MDGLGSSLCLNGRVVDFGRETVLAANGVPVPLRPQCFDVLRYLAHNVGRVVTKDELMAAVWQDIAVTDDSLVQCIHEIRRAIGDERHDVLRTVPRRGYLFEFPAAQRPAPARRSRIGWVAAALVIAVGVVAVTIAAWRPTPAPREVWVAVLPLRSAATDPSQTAFAEALTDDLVTELSRMPSLRVLARNAVDPLDGPGAIEKLREIGANYVLEGRLEVGGDRVHIAARLIDAESRVNVWSRRFEGAADDRFELRDPLVTEIVGTISSWGGVIWRKWLARAEQTHPENLTALELLILAKEPFGRNDEAGIRKARSLIERALTLDPDILIGWLFLAGTYIEEAYSEWGDRAAAWMRFEEAVARAAAIAPEHGRVLTSHAMLAFRRGELEAGLAFRERALTTYPDDVIVLGKFGAISPVALGTEAADHSLAMLDRLAEVDPLHPPSYWLQRAYPLYFSGRYEEAALSLEKLPARWFEARLLLALARAQAGDVTAAGSEAAEVLQLDPSFSAEAWIANDLYQPGSSSVRRFVEGARSAGLPICAADAAEIPVPKRLQECIAGRDG